MRNENKTGVWQMSAAMLISGSIGVFVLLSGQPVTDVVFWRCLVGAVTLFTFARLSGNRLPSLTRKVIFIAALGGVALVLNWLLLFAAYSRLSIGLATLVYNTQPLMLVLMSMLFLGEKVTRAKWFWLLAAFGGMALVLSSQFTGAHNEAWLLGVAMALGAAFFYAMTALITRRLKGVPPQQIALVQVCVGVVMLLPAAHFSLSPTPLQWGILVLLGVVHTGVMYQLLYSAIQKLPTPLTGSLSFIYPLVAIAADQAVFGHSLSLLQLAGGALILLAAAGNNLGWGEKTQPSAAATPR
ncbi:DMT family transporter [Franconibacter helveticus]|uniref:DMT family transporter n=1 Tax=Franconibacter helveticus TaxID=357240 RepID=UPI00066D3972|nr:DMT family transporter [Franconibacter helveticus]